MMGGGNVRPMPPSWALFGAGSALIAGSGAGILPGVAGALLGPVTLVLLHRLDPARALWAAAAGIVLLIVVAREVGGAAVTALPVGACGLLLARGFRKRLPPGRAVAIASIPYLVLGILAFARTAAPEERAREAEETVRSMLALYDSLGMDDATLATMGEAAREAARLAMTVAPAGDFLIFLAMTALAYGLSAAALRRYGVEARPLPPMRLFRAPFGVVWVFAAGLAAVLLAAPPLRDAGANLLLGAGVIYLVQGLAVLRWHFRKRGLPRPVQLLFFAVAVLLVLPFFLFLTVGTGLFDTWFDFRRLEKAPDKTAAP